MRFWSGMSKKTPDGNEILMVGNQASPSKPKYMLMSELINYLKTVSTDSGLQTASKTIIGAINELQSQQQNFVDGDNNFILIFDNINGTWNVNTIANAIPNIKNEYKSRGRNIKFYNATTSKWEYWEYNGINIDDSNWNNTANWSRIFTEGGAGVPAESQFTNDYFDL